MIDKTTVRNTFRDIVVTAVGSRLSTMTGVSGQIPSVIRARDNVTVPDTHYVTIDIVADRNRTKNGVGTVFDTNNNTVWQRQTDYLITFHCYGEDSDDIMNELNKWFDIDSTLSLIREQTGGQVRNINDPVSLPENLATEFMETSMFSLVWGGTDELVDPNSAVITDITINNTYEYGGT